MKDFLDKIGSMAEIKGNAYRDSYIENKVKALVYEYFAKEEMSKQSGVTQSLVYAVEIIDFIVEEQGNYAIEAILWELEFDLKIKQAYKAVMKIKEEGDEWTITDIKRAPQSSEAGLTEDFIEDRNKNILRFRAIAAIYNSFCLFEAPKKDVAAIVNCYAKEFEVMYPWGGCKTNEQLVKWVSGISEKSSFAHHVKKLNISNIQNSEVECSADVTYQTVNDNGEFRSMELHYDFVLQDNENGLPQISRSITTINK